jgi:hypothetical protein
MKGSCLCGSVTFEVQAAPLQTSACHCSQCRKMSGHYWVSAAVPRDALTVRGNVQWYNASDVARRGFCGTCGGFLFWDGFGEESISVAMGALDAPTGLQIDRHIYVRDKGDYYDINDGVPQEQKDDDA